MGNKSTLGLLMGLAMLNSDLNTNGPFEYALTTAKKNSSNNNTHGSQEAQTYSPEEWREHKKDQGRNDLCACGSGKKYKKCCGLTVR